MFCALADVAAGVNLSGDCSEVIGKNGVVEDDGSACGLEAFDGLHESGTRRIAQGNARSRDFRCRRCGRVVGMYTLEGDSGSVKDEGGHTEALALQGIRFQVLSVGARLSVRS